MHVCYWSLMFSRLLRTLGEEDGEGESATDGRTERQRHGRRWGGVMRRKELSHVRERCGDDAVKKEIN